MSHSSFHLGAVESVEKCSWECFREGTKYRPLNVPLGSRHANRVASVRWWSV